VNLEELSRGRFRIDFDSAYRLDFGRGVRRRDPWMMILRCTAGRGHLGPWSATEIAAYLDKPKLASRLLKLGGRLINRGDRDATVVFPKELFEEVVLIMRPRRRRRLSAEHRAKNIQRLRELAAQRAKPALQPAIEAASQTGGETVQARPSKRRHQAGRGGQGIQDGAARRSSRKVA
jgi:hypothetical protein